MNFKEKFERKVKIVKNGPGGVLISGMSQHERGRKRQTLEGGYYTV